MVKSHWLAAAAVFCALLLAGVLLLVSQADDLEPARRISLAPSKSSPPLISHGENKLRIAVAAIISPGKSLVLYEEMFDYLGEKLHREVEMIQRKTYAEVNFLIKEGRIDAAFVCSRAYVEGHRDFGMEILCVPVCFGKTEYNSFFIVHEDSGIQTFGDLRSKVFAFTDPQSNSGMLVPIFFLAKTGETPESFFRRHIFTYSHDNSIRSVAEKFVDGAAVDSLIWEYDNLKDPQYTSQTRIIFRSPPFGIPPVVVPPDLDTETKEQLRSAFLQMHKDPRGRAILKRILIDRFAIIDDSAYDSIREMSAFVEQFRSRQ